MKKQINKLNQISLILGIVSILTIIIGIILGIKIPDIGIINILRSISLPTGTIGLILGIIAKTKDDKKELKNTSIILNAISIIFILLIILFVFFFFTSLLFFKP